MAVNTWIYEGLGAKGGGGGGSGSLIVGFDVNNGATGANVGPMLAAPADGSLSRAVTVVKGADATDCKFNIRRNGAAVFTSDVILPASSSTGTMITSTNFTALPLAVTKDDIFTIDITQGSAAWKFNTQLE